MSFNELDSLMMHADIANQEARLEGVRPALDPNAANPREPFVAVPKSHQSPKEFDFIHVMEAPVGPDRESEEGAISKESRETVKEWLDEFLEGDMTCPKWSALEALAETISEEDPELTTLFVDDEDDSPTIEQAQEFFGGGYVELVKTQSGVQLLIDEDGLMKGLRVNPVASYLYGGKIVGKALVLQGEAKWT